MRFFRNWCLQGARHCHSGIGLDGIVPAQPVFDGVKQEKPGDKVEAFEHGTLNAENKDVVVIGGGDTALIACALQSVRKPNRLAVFTGGTVPICPVRSVKCTT